MKFTVLLYSEEQEEQSRSQDEWQALIEKHNEFSTKHASAVVGGEALEQTTTAKTLRQKNGDLVVSDGPFAETKEQLGGFYILEATDLEQAMLMVRDLPLGPNSSIEVRPVMEF